MVGAAKELCKKTKAERAATMEKRMANGEEKRWRALNQTPVPSEASYTSLHMYVDVIDNMGSDDR